MKIDLDETHITHKFHICNLCKNKKYSKTRDQYICKLDYLTISHWGIENRKCLMVK
jgi:hypothetical protein